LFRPLTSYITKRSWKGEGKRATKKKRKGGGKLNTLTGKGGNDINKIVITGRVAAYFEKLRFYLRNKKKKNEGEKEEDAQDKVWLYMSIFLTSNLYLLCSEAARGEERKNFEKGGRKKKKREAIPSNMVYCLENSLTMSVFANLKGNKRKGIGIDGGKEKRRRS